MLKRPVRGSEERKRGKPERRWVKEERREGSRRGWWKAAIKELAYFAVDDGASKRASPPADTIDNANRSFRRRAVSWCEYVSTERRFVFPRCSGSSKAHVIPSLDDSSVCERVVVLAEIDDDAATG